MNAIALESSRTPPFRVLVLGATGKTGQRIVHQALARGYDVAALVRSLDKGRVLKGAALIVGDARDEQTLRQAMVGRHAVISALGTPASPFRSVTLLSASTRAIVNAMRAENVPRLVCITGLGAGDSRGHGGFLFDSVFFPLMLRHVYADKDRQEAIVRDSGLQWILIRPSILNDKPGGSPIRAMTDLSDFHGGSIPRNDVAKFVVEQLRAETWLHRAPLITA